MDCREDRYEFIEKYLHGQLQPDFQDDFEVHMLGCDRCQQALELLETVHHDLTQRAHVIRANTGPRRLGFRWQWAALAFAGLAFIAWGLVRWNEHSRAQTLVV